MYVYVGDQGNNRVVRRLSSDLSYVDQLATGAAMAVRGPRSDYTNVFIPFTGDGSIRKYDWSDMSYVDQISGIGAGLRYLTLSSTHVYFCTTFGLYKYIKSTLAFSQNIAISGAYGCACDGTYVYVTNNTNSRIEKYLASDLSFVTQLGSFGSGDGQFADCRGMSTDGTYLYIADRSNSRIVIHRCSDLTFYAKLTGFTAPDDVDVDGDSIYVDSTNDNWIYKYNKSTLAYITRNGGTYGSGQDQYAFPYGVGADNPFLSPLSPPIAVATPSVLSNTITWDSVAGATSYNIYWSYVSGTGKSGTKISDVTSPYVHLDLDPGFVYYYVITSYDSGIDFESSASNEVSATPIKCISNFGSIVW